MYLFLHDFPSEQTCGCPTLYAPRYTCVRTDRRFQRVTWGAALHKQRGPESAPRCAPSPLGAPGPGCVSAPRRGQSGRSPQQQRLIWGADGRAAGDRAGRAARRSAPARDGQVPLISLWSRSQGVICGLWAGGAGARLGLPGVAHGLGQQSPGCSRTELPGPVSAAWKAPPFAPGSQEKGICVIKVL